MTDPYAAARPVPPVAVTAIRPLYTFDVNPSPAKMLPNWVNCPGASVTVVCAAIFDSGVYAATSRVTGFPVTSTKPRLERNAGDCSSCTTCSGRSPTPMASAAATPGTTKRLDEIFDGSTGNTSSGSLVVLSSTDAYAVRRPVSLVTITSIRPSLTATLGKKAARLVCWCSNGLRLYERVAIILFLSSNSVATKSTGCPDPSTKPKLVR